MKFARACSLFIISTLALTFLLLSSFAQAVTLKIYEAPMAEFDVNFNPFSFAVDAEKGKAWVVMHEVDYSSVEPQAYDTKVQVKGLSFDKEKSMIVMKDGNEIIDCAQVTFRGAWFFTHGFIVENGRCSFRIDDSKRPVTDASGTKLVRYSEVYFSAQ